MFNANNYGYNPYGRYIPQQPIQQQEPFSSIQNRSPLNILNGKQVESIDVVKAMDIPLDGSISYFPIADGSAIVTKQLQTDGSSKTIIYKPIEGVEEAKQTTYITSEELENKMKDFSVKEVKDIKDELKLIKREIRDIKDDIKEK